MLQEPARNTDGVDTFFSDNITFRRWDVTGGDDAISPKANSSNILIQDATFHGTLGEAIPNETAFKLKGSSTDVLMDVSRCGHWVDRPDGRPVRVY